MPGGREKNPDPIPGRMESGFPAWLGSAEGVDLGVNAHPVQGRPRQDEDVPDTVVILPLPGEGDHPQGVGQPPREDEPQQGPAVKVHPGQEYQPAPPDEEVQREVQGPPAARAEDHHQRHAGEDNRPLDAKDGHPGGSAQIHQQNRGEGAADQQIDGRVIEPPADPLHLGAGGHGVVDAAHQHHHHHADSVHAGGQQLHAAPGPGQQQRQRQQEERQDNPSDSPGRSQWCSRWPRRSAAGARQNSGIPPSGQRR